MYPHAADKKWTEPYDALNAAKCRSLVSRESIMTQVASSSAEAVFWASSRVEYVCPSNR